MAFNSGKIFSNQRNTIAIAVVLFFPLFFLGTRSSHDWGDDFAQYIHQAANIVQGIPQSETGFIYSQVNYIGPKAYPVGFPLLLAPIYAVAGNSLPAFTWFISFIYILLGLLMIAFFRKYFTWITGLVLAFIFVYNPQMIIFKREVMSDIPFTAMLVLNFIIYRKYKDGNFWQFSLLAVCTGLMLIIRPAGIVFVAAVIADQIFVKTRQKAGLKALALKSVLFLVIPVFLYFVVSSIIFRIPSGGSIRDYLLFYYSGNFLGIIPGNFMHHIEVFRYLYVPEAGIFQGFSILLGSVMVAMVLFGFIKRVIGKPELTEWFFVFYILMLLVFPNNFSAFRLMVPIGFLFLLYAVTGLKTMHAIIVLPAWKKAGAIGLLVFLLFLPGLISIARSGQNVLEGPQKPDAIEVFKFINKNISPRSIIVFNKPRALALYAGCRGMADPFTTNPTMFHKQVMDAKASYLLVSNKLTSENMKRYVRVMHDRLTKLFENKEFELYKINPVNPSAHR